MRAALAFIFGRTWLLYALMAGALFLLLDREQLADDVLNASRPSGDYIHAFSYGLRDYNEGELRRAMAYYETLIPGYPWPPLIYANLGFCHFYLHDIPKAVEAYRKAIDKDAYIYTFYFDLGSIVLFQGDYAAAARFFEKSRGVFPANRSEFLNVLDISPKHYQQPLLQEGSSLFRRMDYDLHMIYVYLATCYFHLNENQKLLALTVEGTRLYPDDPELSYYAGVASDRLGYLKEAVFLLTNAIRIASNYAQAYESRAQILRRAGDEMHYQEDMQSAQEARKKGVWRRERELLDLHHWPDAILFFQVYR